MHITINNKISANAGGGGSSGWGSWWSGSGGGGNIETNSYSTDIFNRIETTGGFINQGKIQIITIATSTISTSSAVNLLNSGNGITTINSFLTRIINAGISARNLEIFSKATSTLDGTLAGSNSVKIQGFAFNISKPISATGNNGRVDISSTSSLNISNNITAGNAAVPGSINLNSTSTSVLISGTITINSPYGTTTIFSGTNFNATNSADVSAANIYIMSGGDINIPANSVLNVTNGPGKIGLQSCGKITIGGELYANSGVTTGAVSIFASTTEGLAGSKIYAQNMVYVVYLNSCSGFTNNSGICPPLNVNFGGYAQPTVSRKTGSCTLGGTNIPPYKPVLKFPAPDEVTGVMTCPYLSWVSGDPDGQNLIFEVYLSDKESDVENDLGMIAKIATSSNATGATTTYSFNLALTGPEATTTLPNCTTSFPYLCVTSTEVCDLKSSTTYYWKVKVKDQP